MKRRVQYPWPGRKSITSQPGFTPEKASTSAAWRRASYADRGRYARQLDWLLRHFPREQVLLLRAPDLAARPADTLASALAFLGLPPIEPESPEQRVLAGAYPPPPAWAPGRLLLRWRLRGESRRLRARHGIALGEA